MHAIGGEGNFPQNPKPFEIKAVAKIFQMHLVKQRFKMLVKMSKKRTIPKYISWQVIYGEKLIGISNKHEIIKNISIYVIG